MSEEILQSLTKRERQIMNIVFKHGQADVQQIMDDIPDDITNSTIRTLLRILVNKGALNYRKEGIKFIYSPIVKKDKAKVSMLKSMLNTFFDNSTFLAVSTMIDENSEKMSMDELEELEKMIQKIKKEAR